ncbi:unnamed protein product [Amoebophrya sp. A120]|nr:unnamed protein product [Amoebophrya sp. A120]|eukprot:GSA120T00014583001.1
MQISSHRKICNAHPHERRFQSCFGLCNALNRMSRWICVAAVVANLHYNTETNFSCLTAKTSRFVLRGPDLDSGVGTFLLGIFLGWLFMYLQHAEKGASHFAKDSPWWHQVHVYLGYSLLICWLIQIAGGVLKYTSLPKRGVVKWHGILAQVMFALKQPQFIIAAVMSLWTGSQVHPDSGHYSEVLFSFLFIGMYAAVMGAFYYAGERIYGDADQDETGSLNSKTGAADSDAGERDAEGRPILSSPIGGGGGSTSSPGRI